MPQSVFDMPGFKPEEPAARPQTVFDMTAPTVVPDVEPDAPAEVVEAVSLSALKPRSPKPAGQSAEATEEGK